MPTVLIVRVALGQATNPTSVYNVKLEHSDHSRNGSGGSGKGTERKPETMMSFDNLDRVIRQELDRLHDSDPVSKRLDNV